MLAARRALAQAVLTPVLPITRGLAAWFDASQLTGLADGAQPASLPDLSGNSRTASLTGGTAGARPTYYKTTGAKLVNGRPAVWFTNNISNAQGYYYSTAAFPVANATDGSWCLFVVSYSSYTGANSPAMANGGVGLVGIVCSNGSAGLFQGEGIDNAGTQHLASVGTQPTSRASLMTAQQSLTQVSATIDGASSAGVACTPRVSNNGPLLVGAFNNASNVITGPVCEVLFYTATGGLSGSETAQIQAYLKTKWGTP